MPAQHQWSDETLRLRQEAHEAIDKLARSMHKDRGDWGRRDDWTDEERAAVDLKDQHLTAWVVNTQYQGFDDPEDSTEVACSSGAAGSTMRGLAESLADAYSE
ncbi:hypothetical protein SEA_LYMARA_107 [Arthrobacter phage Lymara]|uniref:Uncharacterized protein n=1 Tax=Arthrobacter phage Lymara TaxID=2599828 RepID=A0A5J6TXA8_9CAUD|nr:hypothetical protein HYQ01_gp107 [Arthrobacter phage Lymara]QFG14908.1 hypothetical protein SEA_LYMARA_107 [Arthrobacter phage Lymara]